MNTLGIDMLHKNQLVPYYLMSSYLYYHCDKQVLNDDEYDALAKRLLNEWDSVEHMHKHLITQGDLTAGTGYAIKYNNRIKNAAERWYDDYKMERN